MKPWIFLWIVLAVPAKASSGAHALSLREAVLFAVEHSPAFDTAKKQLSIRDLEFKSAIAKMLPSFDLTSTHGLQNDVPLAVATSGSSVFALNPTAPWYSSLGLGLTESLYDNGVSLTHAKVADLSRDLARVNFLKARDNLALEIALEYYRFSLASILLEVRKQQQTVLEKQFKTLSNQYQQGFKTKSDYLRLRTQVQRSEIEQVTAENNITLSRTELDRLLGVNYQDNQSVIFEPLAVQRDFAIEALFPAKAPPMESTFDYRIAKIEEEINGKNVTLAQRKVWPQVFLNSGITYNNQNYLNSNRPFSSGERLSWNALITLQYNIWDWGSRRRDVEIAQFNREIQANALNQNLLEINSKMVGIIANNDRISRNFKLSRELLSLEEESNRSLGIQYREGKVMYLDLITSLNNLLDAKVQFYTAYFEALQNYSRTQFYEGKLYETVVEK